MPCLTELIGEVDQKDRVLDLDADQRDEADGRGEGQRVAPQEERRDPADEPSGMTDATISVPLKVRNSKTRIARIPKSPAGSPYPSPPKLSCRLSISPAGTSRKPAGAHTSSFASTAFVTRSVLKPVRT